MNCSGLGGIIQYLDYKGECCIGPAIFITSGAKTEKNKEGEENSNSQESSKNSNDKSAPPEHPCEVLPYFIGATRSVSYLASKFGSQDKNAPWHWGSPEFEDLEKYTNAAPPLFGFLPTAGYGWKFAGGQVYPQADRVNQKCLGLYSRYNGLWNEFLLTKQDQITLGRYTKQTKDYYHDMTSTLINEFSFQVVKWRDYGWWPYLLTPLSLSFWLGGCGQPCYVCSYTDTICLGHHEHALNLAIAALDSYWLIDKAQRGILWPNKRLLVDYYGSIVRGPEPIIGWLFYIMFKQHACSYCSCILFCFLVQCIDPWFIRYAAVASVFTLNDTDGIPQSLPGKFIEYVENTRELLKKDDVEAKDIFWDHMAQERLFIDGTMDYYTADIFNENGTPSGYLLGSQLDPKDPGGKIIGQDYIYLENGKFPYATRTESSGFHMEFKNNEGKECSTEDIEKNVCNSGLKDSIFFGFRTRGSADDGGYFIRNVGVKWYDHNVRKDIWSYNWLYVDIPKPLRTEVTPLVTSFDGFAMHELYFEDIDPLVIMRKAVYYKTILQSGDMVLNGNGQSRIRIGEYSQLFTEDWASYDNRFYPMYWVDRVEFKSVKAPYNLYFMSGLKPSDEDYGFKECLLGETLTGLSPGRYYFPNPYACQATARMAPYNGSIHAGLIERDYSVHDYKNHKKYFSTDLPMQFLGPLGEFAILENGKATYKKYKAMLNEAIKILGDPQTSPYATFTFQSTGDVLSGPIEEFPMMRASGINNVKIVDWSNTGIDFYSEKEEKGLARLGLLLKQRAEFSKDLRKYDQKWWKGHE